MEKYLGLLTCDNLPLVYNLDIDLYTKISKNYKTVFIIDTSLIINKKKPICNFLPKNFKIFFPKNCDELKQIFLNNKFVCFNFIPRKIFSLKIHFYLRNFDIDHLMLIRSGTIKMNESSFIKKSINFVKINKKITHLIYKILVIIGLVKNLDTLFISQKKTKKIYLSERINKFNKLFNTKNFSVYKKVVEINDKTYDVSINAIIKEKYIVFIDTPLHKSESIPPRYKPNETEKKEFYKKLSSILLKLSKRYNKKVIICMHPKSPKKNYKFFKNFFITSFKTDYYVHNAFITLYLSSTVISHSIFLKKNIIIIKSNLLKLFHSYRVQRIISKFKCFYLDLDADDLNIDLQKIKQKRNFSKKKLHLDIILNQKKMGIDSIINNLNKMLLR